MHLSQWPLSRVLLLCLGWVVITGTFFIGLPLVMFTRASKSNGLAAVAFGLTETLVPIFLPPIVFLIVWRFFRRS